jgi:tetratricopeptide (TPR) repeat protein
VSVIQCKFDDQKTVPLGYTFHDLAQFLIEKGYTVIVSEWHPLIKSRIKQDWYRLTKYPCQLGDVKAWGYLIAFKSEPDWLNILNLAKKVLHLKALIIRDAKFHIENAKVLEKQVNLEGAIQEIRMAIDIEPDKMELHYKMGELLLKDKKFKEAVSYYQKTIELKPDYFWAFRGLGDALKEQGELDEALKFYRQAIELNPNYFYPYDKIARVLEMQNKLSEAISYFRQALELKPNSEATLNGLEQCLKKQQISKQ